MCRGFHLVLPSIITARGCCRWAGEPGHCPIPGLAPQGSRRKAVPASVSLGFTQHRVGNCLVLANISPKISPLCIFLPLFLVQNARRMFPSGFTTHRKKLWAKPVFNWKSLGTPQEQAGWLLKVLS